MLNKPITQRVICVLECAEADKLIEQFCKSDNKDWWVPYQELMESVAFCMEGNWQSMFTLLENTIGMPLYHPASYGADDYSEPLTKFVEAIAIALKHALPKLHDKKDNQLLRCRYLETTQQFFVFEVLLQEPEPIKEPNIVVHF